MTDLNRNGTSLGGSEIGQASQWNFTKTIQTTLEDIEIDANFAWLIFSLLIAMFWFTYITHYSARVIGQILTRLLNRFTIGNGYLRIGSLTFDVLAGKIMFRDIVYTSEDFSIRIQDGWLVFRWWRSYVPKDITEDLSHSDTRLSLMLNGLELHIYNRSHLYNELEELFGLESLIIPNDGRGNLANSSVNKTTSKASTSSKLTDDESNSWGARVLGRSWRDLIPVIKVEICCGRAVFGNRLVPTTLCLSMEEGYMVYSTKPAMSKLDHFVHVVTCRAENFKVTLAPSLKYTGLNDEPPRLMGEGFVVLSSNTIDFYYYMDEPGVVPEVPLMVELANGDVVECHAPVWGLDIRCGKGTDFSYGPWADRKREQLFKFFYPPNYQPMKITSPPRPGEKRTVQSFDIRFSTLSEATVDVLFTKCKETNAVHMTIGAGSYLEITIPWTVRPDGCATKISGQLLHVDASTSLQYRSLMEAETLKFAVLMQYPVAWNSHQSWNLSLTGTKATLHLIYEHRYFFQDLINDWSSRNPADLLHHIPYTWFLKFCLKEFELITIANQYNWVDCSSQRQENAYAAFSGDFLELAFALPFNDFLPPTMELKFQIQGESLDMNVQLPEMSTSRPVLLALAAHARTAARSAEQKRNESPIDCDKERWRNLVKRSEGWVQCWTVPVLSLAIQYTYHPMTPPGPAPQANVPTPEREELLLTPVRFPVPTTSCLQVPLRSGRPSALEFDPTTLKADQVNVEIELGPSELFVYGTVLRVFLNLKENIFGEDQRMADMDPSAAMLDMERSGKNESLNRSADPIPDTSASMEDSVIDVRIGRPLHVNVSATLHDIKAHLMKHCSKDDPPCPTVFLEKISFEMNKTFLETKLQLLVSPAVLYSTDTVLRTAESCHLQQGFLVLSALQVRGHAMFSPTGRAIDEDTIEYAWLIEATLGQLTGRMTMPQLHHVTAGLEVFLRLALDEENQMIRPPKSQTSCHHGTAQPLCSFSTTPNQSTINLPTTLGSLCPSSEDIKYRMTRLSIDLIDFSLVESGTAVTLQIYPLRLATCNLHTRRSHAGVSILMPKVHLRQYLSTCRGPNLDSSFTALNATDRYKSGAVKMSSSNSTWNRTQASGYSRSSVEELYMGREKPHSPIGSHRIDFESAAPIANGIPCQEWLEVGLVEIGPIYVDVGSSADHCRVDLPALQSAFLRLHDTRTHRLWFLWDNLVDLNDVAAQADSGGQPNNNVGKCGCRGGCAFFGRNFNGFGFFNCHEDDLLGNSDHYVALANPLLSRGTDPAFSQSILRTDAFLIDFDPPARTGSNSPPMAAASKERPRSDVSNTSTMKNVCAVLILPEKASHSSHVTNVNLEETREGDEELNQLTDFKTRSRTRMSLRELENHSIQQSGSRQRELGTANSTPSLPMTSPGTKRKIFSGKRMSGQNSMPALADQATVEYRHPCVGRKRSTISSRTSRTESQSELYYSAEEDDDDMADSSPSDELVSFPASLPDNTANLLISDASRNSKCSVASSSSSSTRTSPSSSSRMSSRPTSRTSNISFNSALSSADDFSLVDLHLQSARPVVDSPLLLTSYISHLGEAECPNWSQTAPKFPTEIRQACTSKLRFHMTKSGFSSFRLVDRPLNTPGHQGAGFGFFAPHSKESVEKNGQPWVWDASEEERPSGTSGTKTERCDTSTVLVKVGRPIHIMCCPLSLESAQRFVETLVPTLEHLHPMTLMTRIYGRSISHVESQNPLKKQRMALLEQKTGPALYRDLTVYQLRGSIQIPRINLCLLQAGIVEQFISLSMLDNPRDLVCVSSAAVCVDALSLHFSQNVRECRWVQAVSRPVEQRQSGGNKSFFASVQKPKSRPGKSLGVPEIVFVEWTQTENEQIMASGTLGKIHLQMRRLNNDTPSQTPGLPPDNVTATVIPTGCSRVLFSYANDHELSAQSFPIVSDEERYGSVVFECGLQGLNLRAVKRVSNVPETGNTSENNDPKGSVVTTVEMETIPLPNETPTIDDQPPGSAPSHSSHISFKQRSEKGTPTSAEPPDAHHQQNAGLIRPQAEKDLSSCSLQIQAVWLSFAAPPRTSPAKKSEFALLDRNLLSTASPAINAWMNSGDRLAITVMQLVRAAETRSLSVLAGLMAEALDVQQIHLPIKSKYNCLSLMSRTLQEDPSCQLNLVLHRYVLMLRNEWATLEARLAPSIVPPLSTLKQGVIVLGRQWKSAIYTPFMLTYSLHKNSAQKAPANLSVPVNSHYMAMGRDPGRLHLASLRSGALSADFGDEDERLLAGHNEAESSWISSDESSLVISPADLNESSLPLLGRNSISQPSSPPKISALRRKLTGGTHPSGFGGSYELKTISASSAEEENDEEDASVPLRKTDKKESREEFDLYNWLARQQRSSVKPDQAKPTPTELQAQQQQSQQLSDQKQPHQQFNLLVDTRAIFVSLFASVGLESKRTISDVLSLSGSASVLGGIEELRVEIFESEWNQTGSSSRRSKMGKTVGHSSGRGKNATGGHKFSVYIPPEVPAFLCERMSIEIQVNQVSDGGLLGASGTCCDESTAGVSGRGQSAESDTAAASSSAAAAGGTGFLGQIGLWKPQRTTALNFSVSVGYLSQQVNMPLLRLLHQLSSVYGNAKATQVQLREQRPLKRGPDPLRALTVIFDSPESTPSPPLPQRPIQSEPEPSPSIQSESIQFANRSFRPPSFLANRLRSSSRFAKMYDHEDNHMVVPTTLATDTSKHVQDGVDPSPLASATAATVGLPSCWRTIYHLLDLYSSMTAASTVNKQHSISEPPNCPTGDPELGLGPTPASMRTDSRPPIPSHTTVVATRSERTRIVVFGIMKVNRVRLLAMLSGLRLESEIVSLHTSLTYKEKVRVGGLLHRSHAPLFQHNFPRMECSLTGHLGRAMIVLLEGVAPSQQTVVKITVGKSQALYSRLSHHGKDKNSGLLSIGAVHVDIPQHPGVLHGMMTRGSKQLSSTLQEFRVPRLASRNTGRNTSTIPDELDLIAGGLGAGGSGVFGTNVNALGPLLQSPPKEIPAPIVEHRSVGGKVEREATTNLLQPLVMQFSIVLQRLSITAALLPSLQAQYQMEQVVSAGITGSKAKFDIDLPRHSLSFTTKLQITENLPPSASIELPQVHVGAEYLQDSVKTEGFVDGVVLCRGNYLSAVAEIGVFEHSLTTDLLNHLVFVQKVFMAEVNDVLNKVSGGDKPVPLWEEQPADQQQPDSSAMRMLLYHLIVRLKGIQITATTPTNTAVRLETGLVELQLSNRVQNVFSQSNAQRSAGTFAPPSASSSVQASRPAKLFGRAKVDLNLSLGQLIRNPLFEEAEAEFQQVAFFKTRISLRNAFQDELTPNEPGGVDPAADKEVVLITLTRPLIYLQPVAVDKAILVWLNYKNAYEYWTEQRGGWIKDASLVADKSDKLDKLGQLTSQLGVGAPSLGTLFLQLTVDDMGICMPLNMAPTSLWTGNGTGRSESNRQGHSSEPDICSAVVVTLENSSISACSSGSLVSKGKFTGLCLRFADDFETGLDDWKPDMDDPAIMNLCVVSEGTYEVCSRTVTPAQHQHGENAKWILHVGWQMEGVDTHFDTSIGRQFSALGHTLTGLTGSEEEEEEGEFGDDYDGVGIDGDERSSPAASPCDDIGEGSALGASTDEDETMIADAQDVNDAVELRRRRGRIERAVTISDTVATMPRGGRHRSKLIEKEMSEQARIIQDLKLLGASSATVEQEMRRLQELEALASKDFRRVMLQRLKRQSVKASSIITDHPVTSTSLSSVSGNAAMQRPASLHHTQSQRAPPQSQTNHQRSRSVVVPPVVLDLEPSGHGSTDDFLLRDAQRFLLPPIEGSPPMSCLPTPTSDAYRSGGAAGTRRPRTPTSSIAGGGPSLLEQERDRSGATSAAENPSGLGSGTRNSSEPSVDLELDFKVFINSGKCVLHTRDTRNDEMLRRMKKERSFSSSILDAAANPHQPSPAPARKPGRPDMRHNASTSRLRVLANNTAQMAVDLTIFHIPGLDVKVYYESKTVHEETLHIPTPINASASPVSSATNKGKLSNKKGSLFAWMTLHSIPEETIISPHILEFLEQALEPIPITAPEAKPTPTSTTENSGLFIFDGPPSTGSPGSSTTASFPVDVVVYCHVQPSTFRFSCLPVSRVECLLRLPSLHLVFSSKRSENQALTGGGLSVTGCLSDFSLYIFHPYGGGKKTSGTSSKREANDCESERKDSLSVNVEFVKFNLSRSRKVNFSPRTAAEAGNREPRNGRDSASDPAKAVVRFSTLIDIGSASFKYDMRRLPEILAFPKAWYRRAIVRHLFLGDLSKTDSSAPDLVPPAGRDLWAELQPDQSGLSPASAWETLVVFAVNFTKLNVHMNMGNVMGNVSWLTKDFKAEGRLSIGSTGHKNMHIGIGLEGSGLDAKGGIVGGTIELSGINTSLSIREDPGTEPDHRMSIKLQVLECRLDYMGTSVLMGRVSVLAVDLRDEWRIGNLIKNPDKVPARRTSIASSPTKRPAMIFIHGDLGWDQLQLMISKSTTADLIKMYLKLDEFFQQQFRSSRRIFSTLSATGGGHSSIRRKGGGKNVPAKIAVSAEPTGPTVEAQHHRHWQSVLKRVAGLEIATLPTPLPLTGTILGGTMELHGGHISLACFHGVNFKSKSWALFSLKDPCVSFATEAQEIPGDSDPKNIHVVQNLSFSLGLSGPGSHTPVGIGYRVIEQQQQQNSPASMATVCRISRTQLFPPQFKTIQDWFLYAFANSRLDAMERFPSLERERSSSGAPHVSVKIPDYHHAAEIIFAFPSLQLHLKSEHLQTGSVPSLTEEKPSVDCSFITDFEDHIFVTVDAEAFFFLHDLISSYVREKERVILASAASNQRTQSPELQKAAMGSTTAGSTLAEPNPSQGSPGINNPSLSLQLTNEDEKKRRILEQIDWRSYECKTWHLEPTVRLLSWAGKRIEPYGVEYILNKLGFSQARTTIPKWVQRGAMDPLDKILSLVLSRTIAAQRAKVSQAASSTSPGGVIICGGGGSGSVSSNNTVNSTRPSTK